jgi:hypothetical protein
MKPNDPTKKGITRNSTKADDPNSKNQRESKIQSRKQEIQKRCVARCNANDAVHVSKRNGVFGMIWCMYVLMRAAVKSHDVFGVNREELRCVYSESRG